MVLAETREPPLLFRRQFLSDKFLLKKFAFSNHPILSSLPALSLSLRNNNGYQHLFHLPLLKAYNKLLHLKPLIEAHPFPLFYDIAPSTDISNLIIDIKSRRLIQASADPKAEFLARFNNCENSPYFFTDGSKSEPETYVDFAIHCSSLSLSLKYRISSFASIFSAEALAILHTINLIISKNIPEAFVFTDSLSCLQSLLSFSTSGRCNSFIVGIAKALIQSMDLNSIINLVLIPGHHGIPGNEMVDSSAKLISDGETFITCFPPSDFFPLAREKCSDSSERLLRSGGNFKGNLYFRNFYNASPKPWFHEFKKLNRKDIATLSRMRSNHHSLRASLFRQNLIQSPSYSCGFDSQDLNYVFWACPEYHLQRTILTKSLSLALLLISFQIA